jgi:hypothetical protein
MKITWIAVLAVLIVAGCTTEDNCCPACSNPNDILIKAPGGECKCYSSCPSNVPGFLQEALGQQCCTDEGCSGPAPTPTTLAACQVVGNVCTGYCPDGQTCSDTGPALQYPYNPICGCLTSCNLINDYKQCRSGGCPQGQICQMDIKGECTCGSIVN